MRASNCVYVSTSVGVGVWVCEFVSVYKIYMYTSTKYYKDVMCVRIETDSKQP